MAANDEAGGTRLRQALTGADRTVADVVRCQRDRR
jgi:hypothetical protein